MSSKVKSFRVFLLTVVLVFVTVISGRIPSASAETADFRQLNASQIVFEMGAGWNLGNQLELSSNGTPSESTPNVTQAFIQGKGSRI